MSLYEINNLQIQFPTPMGTVHAVRDISFTIEKNQCVALVGESGCGKSVTARSLVGLTEVVGGHVTGGQVLFQGQDILQFTEREWQSYRGSKAAIIFQDIISLN